MLLGLSDLIFEVLYGATEGVHSKAKEILKQIISGNDRGPLKINLIRHIYLKLINEIDTEK